MTITMYDLAGAEPNRRFSPFCWRARMALAHKGLAVETVPWGFTEKDKLPQPNAGRVPVIVHRQPARLRSATALKSACSPIRPIDDQSAVREPARLRIEMMQRVTLTF